MDAALDTAIPAAPTGDSINDYIVRTKRVVVNKLVITEATGNAKVFEDDDATSILVSSAFTSDATDTTRKKLE